MKQAEENPITPDTAGTLPHPPRWLLEASRREPDHAGHCCGDLQFYRPFR